MSVAETAAPVLSETIPPPAIFNGNTGRAKPSVIPFVTVQVNADINPSFT